MFEWLKTMKGEASRFAVDLLLLAALVALFFSGAHQRLPPALQAAGLKSLVVSAGFLAAHVTGKLAFPTVDWSGSWSPAHVVRIVLYATMVHAYALGG